MVVRSQNLQIWIVSKNLSLGRILYFSEILRYTFCLKILSSSHVFLGFASKGIIWPISRVWDFFSPGEFGGESCQVHELLYEGEFSALDVL